MYNFIFYWWDSKMFLFFRTTFVTKSNFWLFFEQLFEKLQETFWKISSNLWKALGVANQNAVFASSCPLVDATIQHCTIKKICNLENICKHMAIETTANDKQQNWVPGIWDLTKKKNNTHTQTHTHIHICVIRVALMAYDIWLLPGKRDSPKFGHGMGNWERNRYAG